MYGLTESSLSQKEEKTLLIKWVLAKAE